MVVKDYRWADDYKMHLTEVISAKWGPRLALQGERCPNLKKEKKNLCHHFLRTGSLLSYFIFSQGSILLRKFEFGLQFVFVSMRLHACSRKNKQ